MRRFVIALLCATFPVVAAHAQDRDFTVVSYGGVTQQAYQAAYFEPFKKETGEALVEDTDPSLSKIRAMAESGNVTWDLIDQESGEAIIGCDEGLFEEYDRSRMELRAIPEEDLLPCGVPIYRTGNVLAYDADRLKDNPPKTWADFWDVETWPGKRGIWNTPKGALEIALMADGVEPAEVYNVLKAPGGVDRAFGKLDELKPNLLPWNSGAEFLNRLASGEYTMTFAWNGHITAANQANNRNFQIAWPAGFTLVTDYWVAVKGTPHMESIYKFFEIFSRPDRQAEFMKIQAYSASNPESIALLPPERQAVLPMSPENLQFGVPVDDTFWADNYDSLTERFNAWLAQ